MFHTCCKTFHLNLDDIKPYIIERFLEPNDKNDGKADLWVDLTSCLISMFKGKRNILFHVIVINKSSTIIILTIFCPNPRGWGPIDYECLSACPSVIDSFPTCIFVTDGCKDLGIGSNEISWHLDVP